MCVAFICYYLKKCVLDKKNTLMNNKYKQIAQHVFLIVLQKLQ